MKTFIKVIWFVAAALSAGVGFGVLLALTAVLQRSA
jgi:hypothetical protein